MMIMKDHRTVDKTKRIPFQQHHPSPGQILREINGRKRRFEENAPPVGGGDVIPGDYCPLPGRAQLEEIGRIVKMTIPGAMTGDGPEPEYGILVWFMWYHLLPAYARHPIVDKAPKE